MELPGCLQDARFSAFREHNPFGMALQFLNYAADKSHGR